MQEPGIQHELQSVTETQTMSWHITASSYCLFEIAIADGLRHQQWHHHPGLDDVVRVDIPAPSSFGEPIQAFGYVSKANLSYPSCRKEKKDFK